jgi:glycosyltransferase 2 family protein
MPRWLRITIATALMIALASLMDWGSLRAHAADMNWLIATVAFVAIVLEMPVNAMKWFWSLRLHDQKFGWNYLFRIGCMSFFFNNFLPSAIGGDVYRVYRTWSGAGDKSAAISAVLVERLVGVAVLMLNGFLGALLLMEHALAKTFVMLCLVAGAAGVIALPLLIRLARRGVLSRRFSKLAGVESMLERILRLRSEWLWLLLGSLFFQILAALVVFLCFAAVGSSIDVPTALLVTAAAGLASVLPISISGLGVVEGSIAATMVALGGDLEAAVLAALLLRVLALAVSGLCGLWCFFDDGKAPQSERGASDARLQSTVAATTTQTTM